ncbi:hypothetical protein IT072_03790 [Leifsonia sp. ZF2019]|uniref:hypothetical protein n=1 Tax=Leifsonia sp. ZF2019 TaxID=2781978 RepID=UPI001CBDCEC3|nr:hypothetical protein [Leifsonia sp. ZF2019]UAJ80180.1 hypothetical protein IT072_03790 [Leifsonia sp. ZF2019]
MVEDDVPEELPEFATFSAPFRRSGHTYQIGGQARDHWVLRRFDESDRGTDIGFIKKHGGKWGFVDASLTADAHAALADDWRELVRLYT